MNACAGHGACVICIHIVYMSVHRLCACACGTHNSVRAVRFPIELGKVPFSLFLSRPLHGEGCEREGVTVVWMHARGMC